MTRLALLCALGPALVGCDWGGSGQPPSLMGRGEEVPSSIVAQPVILEAAVASSSASLDVDDTVGRFSPPPLPLEINERLPVDSIRTKVGLTGIELEANWSWPSQQTGPSEHATPGASDLRIDLTSSGRMRLTFLTPTTTMAAGAALLGRVDRYGSLIAWPNKPEYRTLPPGMVRALLDDRRVDASPLSTATVTERGRGSRLGLATRRIELSGAFGVTTLEVARVREAGRGSLVLCRLLVELGGIDPGLAPCLDRREFEVPLSASYAWASQPEKVSLRLEVVAITLHDGDTAPVAVPSADLTATKVGVPSGKPLLSEVGATESHDTGAESDPSRGMEAPQSLTAINQSHRTMFLVMAGKPVAALEPGAQVLLSRLPDSKVSAEWRSFLGDEQSPVVDITPGSRVAYPPTSSDEANGTRQ